MVINPYDPPAEGDSQIIPLHRDPSAHDVFLAWERLRVWYNAVLLLVTLIVLPLFWTEWVKPRPILRALATSAIIANICFCIGPCAEGYLSWLGALRMPARLVVFVAGAMLSILLVVVQLYRITYPPF